jgi:hypothetical protein
MADAEVFPAAYKPLIGLPSSRKTRANSSVKSPPFVPRSPGQTRTANNNDLLCAVFHRSSSLTVSPHSDLAPLLYPCRQRTMLRHHYSRGGDGRQAGPAVPSGRTRIDPQPAMPGDAQLQIHQAQPQRSRHGLGTVVGLQLDYDPADVVAHGALAQVQPDLAESASKFLAVSPPGDGSRTLFGRLRDDRVLYWQ